MLCQNCFKSKNPVPEFSFETFSEVSDHDRKELYRLYSEAEQEEIFAPYRERITSLLLNVQNSTLPEEEWRTSLNDICKKESKHVEYTCDSCGKSIAEDFEIPLLWLIEDEYRNLLKLFISQHLSKLGSNQDSIMQFIDFTSDLVLMADEWNSDEKLAEENKSITRLLKIANSIPKEMGMPSDTHQKEVSVLSKVLRLSLTALSEKSEPPIQNMKDDAKSHLDLLGKTLDEKSRSRIAQILNDFLKD